jgi:signal peptidase I
LPEEILEIKDGKVLINGNTVPGEIYYYNGGDFGKEGQKIHIPASCYYVLGDNSAKSRDSRFFGVVLKENIIAKAVRIYWPIHRVKNI